MGRGPRGVCVSRREACRTKLKHKAQRRAHDVMMVRPPHWQRAQRARTLHLYVARAHRLTDVYFLSAACSGHQLRRHLRESQCMGGWVPAQGRGVAADSGAATEPASRTVASPPHAAAQRLRGSRKQRCPAFRGWRRWRSASGVCRRARGPAPRPPAWPATRGKPSGARCHFLLGWDVGAGQG